MNQSLNTRVIIYIYIYMNQSLNTRVIIYIYIYIYI